MRQLADHCNTASTRILRFQRSPTPTSQVQHLQVLEATILDSLGENLHEFLRLLRDGRIIYLVGPLFPY